MLSRDCVKVTAASQESLMYSDEVYMRVGQKEPYLLEGHQFHFDSHQGRCEEQNVGHDVQVNQRFTTVNPNPTPFIYRGSPNL